MFDDISDLVVALIVTTDKGALGVAQHQVQPSIFIEERLGRVDDVRDVGDNGEYWCLLLHGL